MWIEGKVSGDVRILGLSGEFDAAETRELARELDAATSAEALRVVLNVEKLRFAGAAALGCLAHARAKARMRAGDLVLSGPSTFLRSLLRTVGLERSLRAFPDDEAALRHFGARGGRLANPPAPRSWIRFGYPLVLGARLHK